jgi:hypothetical protein
MVMVMLMLEMILRDPENVWFHARAGAVTFHTTLTAVRVTFR